MKKTVFITGGGTGGHIYPALAIYKALEKDDYNVFYIGNPKKLEFDIAKKNNLNFLPVDIDAMPRKISINFLFWIIKTLFTSLMCLKYFFKYRPCATFATGGYVSAPAIIASILTNTPYMLHDSDLMPGIVTKAFSPCAKIVSTAFKDAKLHIKNKNVIFNGSPIRESFKTISKESARDTLKIPYDKFVILIMGGSQGAKSINSASRLIIEKYKNDFDKTIILQTGKKNYDDFIKNIDIIPDNTIIQPYFDDMTIPLIASDLVISRAGSLSISEICASDSPSILIPYPYASGNHQRLNAKVLEDFGASLYIEDDEKLSDTLINKIDYLLNNKEILDKMRECAIKYAKKDAAENIKNELIGILK